MSLVNDVLDSQNYDKPSGFVHVYFNSKIDDNKWLILSFIATFLMLTLFSFVTYISFDNDKYYPIENDNHITDVLYSDVLIYRNMLDVDPVVEEQEVLKQDNINIKENIQIDKKVDVANKVEKKAIPLPIEKKVISKKDIAIADDKKGTDTKNIVSQVSRDIKDVNTVNSHFPNHINEEIKLRNLLNSNPASVWSYVKTHYGDISKNPRLLAISAQAEQKSGNHKNAINLYRKLINSERKEPRWYSAIGFSFEKEGDYESAHKMYTVAIKLGGLPGSLNTFTLSRLDALAGIVGAEK
ncbi:MAG: hypothetical protein JXR16_01230 [Bermanella sp.]